MTLELPGGKVDAGETPFESGSRELREETGYVAPELELLASLDVDASKAANQGHVFLARNAERMHEPGARDGVAGGRARPVRRTCCTHRHR